MARIPLEYIETALTLESDDLTDMIILNGPCYLLVVDGKVNIVFETDPYKTHMEPLSELLKYLRSQKIPKIWQ